MESQYCLPLRESRDHIAWDYDDYGTRYELVLLGDEIGRACADNVLDVSTGNRVCRAAGPLRHLLNPEFREFMVWSKEGRKQVAEWIADYLSVD